MNNAQTQKGYKGLPMEGFIASWYAKTTLKDLKRHRLMAKQLVNKIPAGGRVLEIAPGPGYFCIELAQLGNFQISGLDISKSFVEIARRNAADAGLKIDLTDTRRSATRVPTPMILATEATPVAARSLSSFIRSLRRRITSIQR